MGRLMLLDRPSSKHGAQRNRKDSIMTDGAERNGLKQVPFQVKGSEFLASRKKGMLADDPGLGKTGQAIMALEKLPPMVNGIIVCPKSAMYTWLTEFELWNSKYKGQFVVVRGTADKRARMYAQRPFVVVTYESYKADLKANRAPCNYQFAIADEGHRAAN